MAATGYNAWAVTAGEQPTTAYWNILGANDASFNSGNGFNDGIILSRHLANGSVLTPAMAPTYKYVHGTISNGTGSRTAVTTSGLINGTTTTYTTGATNEVLFITIATLVASSVAASGVGISVNGVLSSERTYEGEPANTYQSRTVTTLYNAAANTTYTIGIYAWIDSGTLTVCNAVGDIAQGYDPKITIISWGR